MKRFLLGIIVLLSVACGNGPAGREKAITSIRREVILADSLGVITFDSPLRYDTAFAWMHYSDCNTCHERKYRSQSRRYPIIKETGWAWRFPKDSIDRFTIDHQNYYYPPYGNDSILEIGVHGQVKEQLLYRNRLMQITFDTIAVIHDRQFSIVAMEGKDSLYHKLVFARTTINGNFINFSCELIVGKQDSISDSFIKQSIDLFHSIRIVNGKARSKEGVGKMPTDED